MKLTEMKFEDMTDLLAAIAVEMGPLLEDEEVTGLLEGLRKHEREDNEQYGKRIVKKLFTTLNIIYGKHSAAVDRVLAVLFGCCEYEIERKTMKELSGQIKTVLNDRELLGFFSQSAVSGGSAL